MPISTSDMKGGTRITKQDLENWRIHPMKNAFTRANSRLFDLNSQLCFFRPLVLKLNFFLRNDYWGSSLWVLHWSSWGRYQKPSSTGASPHPFARRVSTSFSDDAKKRLSPLYARLFFKMYLFFVLLNSPGSDSPNLWSVTKCSYIEQKPVTQVNIATSEGLGLRQDLLLFSNQPHRSTWKPSTFVPVGTIIWVRIFYTLKSPHAHPLSRR